MYIAKSVVNESYDRPTWKVFFFFEISTLGSIAILSPTSNECLFELLFNY